MPELADVQRLRGLFEAFERQRDLLGSWSRTRCAPTRRAPVDR